MSRKICKGDSTDHSGDEGGADGAEPVGRDMQNAKNPDLANHRDSSRDQESPNQEVPNQEILRTRESQYQRHVELREQHGLVRMGMCASQTWRDDPKRLTFVLARYKFVAKMFSGLERVLEIGCGDTFGTKIVRQEVDHVTAIDFDPLFIESAKECSDSAWPIETFVHDILVSPFGGQFSAAFSLDVLEHIPPDLERTFVENIAASVREHGPVIFGSPSLESQPYASPLSKAGHVNCKDHASLKKLLQSCFHNVFIFSMNDEVVHTGFSPLAHYRLALCCGKRTA